MDELVSLVIVFECAHLVFGIKGWIAEDGGDQSRVEFSLFNVPAQKFKTHLLIGTTSKFY